MRNLKKGVWLVAFSTGPDSMALVQYCLKEKIHFACAFVNYHHRKQSEEEERYAKAYCKEHGITLHVLNDPFDDETGNFEQEARVWRYNFFKRLVEEYHYEGVLIGHHLDDLLETYLMQKEKNLIPTYYGLQEEGDYQGMVVIRPLLKYRKKELQDELDQKKIRYYIDHTNFDESTRRNYYRHQVISKMNESELIALKEEIDEKNRILETQRKKAADLFVEDTISYHKYLKEEKEVRLLALRMLIEEKDPLKRKSKAHLEQFDQIICRKNDFLLSYLKGQETWWIALEEDMIFTMKESEDYEYTFLSIQELFEQPKKEFKVFHGEPSVYSVTVSEKDFPLTIRNAKHGDKIQQRFGTKSLHRFFIDRKIPLYRRKSYPVVLNCEKKVILVPEIGCDPSYYSISPSFSVLQWSVYSRREGIKEDE